MKKIMFLFLFYFSFTVGAQPDFKKKPIVYGLSASFLSHGYQIKGLKAVTRRLPEIKELGANIIWMQPITPPFEEDGHGYDVVDYETVWSHLGSEEDLKTLIREAHRLKMGVMLDVVLNHSSFEHPFVQDIVKNGKNSKFYSFYQHAPIAKIPYAQHFQKRNLGDVTFIHYFWDHLLNFNYSDENLREYMFSNLENWVRKYDIDGFRFDASWGPSTRWPLFYKTLSARLRKVKPHIILMAEDMIGYPAAYVGSNHPHLMNSGFDWAYDWDNKEKDYLSKWAFQLDGDNFEQTVFNIQRPEDAATAFINALKTSEATNGLKPVRYLENNDTPGSLRYHNLKQAQWGATLLFLLPGVPLIFYGQETGNNHEMFELPSFNPAQPMKNRNVKLWSFYQKLTKMRASNEALSLGTMSKIKKVSTTRLSFERVYKTQKVLIELDFKTKEAFLNGKAL